MFTLIRFINLYEILNNQSMIPPVSCRVEIPLSSHNSNTSPPKLFLVRLIKLSYFCTGILDTRRHPWRSLKLKHKPNRILDNAFYTSRSMVDATAPSRRVLSKLGIRRGEGMQKREEGKKLANTIMGLQIFAKITVVVHPCSLILI